MARYRLSGVVVESSVPLPELPPATGDPACIFEIATGRGARRPRWYHHWQEADGGRWLSFARTPAGYLLRFPSLADFEVPRAGRGRGAPVIGIRPRAGVPADTLRHLLLDQIWPLVLSGSGRLVLHASAVVLAGGRAVAFAGPAGAGKSTLAASLASGGCGLVADDCLLIEKRGRGWQAVPSYPGLRLWPDMGKLLPRGAGARVAHYTSKTRYAAGVLRFARRPAPLAAIYVVRASGARAKAAVTQVSGAQALMDLVPYTYLLDYQDREQLERSFAGLARLTTAVPVFRLDVPRAVRRLAEVGTLVTRTAR